MKFRKFINFFFFFCMIILTIGLCLSAIPNKFGDMCEIIVQIGMWIEVGVGVIYSYFFARSKEQSWFMFGFGIAVIALITLIIINLAS